MKVLFYKFYYKLPRCLRSIISMIVYKPQISTKATLFGWSIFSKNVTIGEYSFLNQNKYMSDIEIGKYCCIAENLSAGLDEHPLDSFSNFRMVGGILSPFRATDFPITLKNAKRESKHIVVMNDVWIGADVTIKGGVTIGNGAVIGTGSLVTKNVPPYAVVGGVPAKVIRYRFDDKKIEYLQKIKWWDMPQEKLQGEIPKLDRMISN